MFYQYMCLFSCYHCYIAACHWLLNWSYIKYFDSESYWFYIEIKKVFFFIWRVYFHIGHSIEENQQHVSSVFKTNYFKEWMKKFVALLTKEKRLRMNGKMMTDFLQAFYSVYKKLGQFFFHTYLLTYLKKDTSVLLKIINIWTS